MNLCDGIGVIGMGGVEKKWGSKIEPENILYFN